MIRPRSVSKDIIIGGNSLLLFTLWGYFEKSNEVEGIANNNINVGYRSIRTFGIKNEDTNTSIINLDYNIGNPTYKGHYTC